MGVDVEVALDSLTGLTSFQTIFLEPDMSLNRFRRACSRCFKQDILSIFLVTGEKATDTTEIRRCRRVIASPYFYLRNMLDISDNKLSHVCTGSRLSTSCHDLNHVSVQVEILSHPASGKTTLIQSFVHETLKRERNNVIEAVFRKSLDIESCVIEFEIRDTSEALPEDYPRRLLGRQAVLISLSKDRLVEQVFNNNFKLAREWVLERINLCKRFCPDAVVFLLVTKFDIMSEHEAAINEFLSSFGRSVELFRVSVREDALGTDLKNPSQVFNTLAERMLTKAVSKIKKGTEVRSGSRFSREVHPPTSILAPGWLQSIGKLFSCSPGQC